MIQKLNKDQLNGLAVLCFDLAKGAFAFVLLPSIAVAEEPVVFIVKIFSGLFCGFVFIYGALVLLKVKERKK